MVAASLPVNIQDRVRLEGHNATVRYIGEVLGQAGDWVGLEWDVESRGKNDGSVKGHQYFRCRGQSGSFIRLQKFLQTADKGKTILQAVSERYRPDAHEEDLSISTVTRKQLQVKLVGRAKAHARQGQLDSLQAANVSSAGISSTVRPVQKAIEYSTLRSLKAAVNLSEAVLCLFRKEQLTSHRPCLVWRSSTCQTTCWAPGAKLQSWLKGLSSSGCSI